MPLARHALYADGEEVHVASWPGSAAQTGDIARFIALEGRVFVVLASGLISADTVPTDFPFHQLIREKPEGFYNGGSCMVAPTAAGWSSRGSARRRCSSPISSRAGLLRRATASTRRGITRGRTSSR